MSLRTIFVVVGIVSGAGVGFSIGAGELLYLLAGAAIGAVITGAMIALEQRLVDVPLPLTLGGALGLGVGLLVSGIFSRMAGLLLDTSTLFGHVGGLIVFLTLPYLGLIVGMRFGTERLVSADDK